MPNIIGSRIRSLRKKENMSQLELAKKLQIANSTLCQYESGQRVPSDETKLAIAKVFNVTVDYLLGNENAALKKVGQILNGKTYMIPIFESVSAGFGKQANNEIVDYIPLMLNSDYEADETICIRVSGNSMYPKIEDGDLIQVHKQDSIDSGRVGVFLIDGTDGVIKKVIYTYGEDWLELHSFNPEYAPRRFDGPDVMRVRTLGLVKRVIKDV